MKLIRKIPLPLTLFLFSVCTLLWLWNEKEARSLKKTVGEFALTVGLTPVQRALFFDYPKTMECLEEVIVKYKLRSSEDIDELSSSGRRAFQRAERVPMWTGIALQVPIFLKRGKIEENAPLFEKIRKGQVWRFFSPSLLHKDLFHLMFNMGWLWILGSQIEHRLKKSRYVLLVLVIGIISNTAQYLMGGPYFLGFSGVVAGLTGFIWIRQRKAPEEGYPMPKATALFIFYFILGMMAVEGLAFALQTAFPVRIPINIANTAHVAGGVAGLVLGRFRFFSGRSA